MSIACFPTGQLESLYLWPIRHLSQVLGRPIFFVQRTFGFELQPDRGGCEDRKSKAMEAQSTDSMEPARTTAKVPPVEVKVTYLDNRIGSFEWDGAEPRSKEVSNLTEIALTDTYSTSDVPLVVARG